MRKVIIPAAIMLGITTFGINEYNNYQNEQLIDRIRKSEYNPQTMIEVKLEEKRQQEEMDRKIQEQIDRIAEYKRSDEYKLREETRHWREELGISIDEIEKVKMTVSHYSDLPQHNGGYVTDVRGNKLTHGTVANNILPLGTNIYMEGEIYTVNDIGGSNFNKKNRVDKFVQRLPNESDEEYIKRIWGYGIKNVDAYIIKR